MGDDCLDSRRVALILRRLSQEYGEVESFLDFHSPFELLIAVILSARTTDRRVNLVTPTLFERFPTPRALAQAKPSELETILHSVGFFRAKARNITATAELISGRFGGIVPASMEELISLPGVGRKSANVIRGTIFGKPAIIVDTHFGRVVRRLGLTSEDDPVKVEVEIARTVSAADHMRFSMLINKHGRLYCHARAPDCEICPIRTLCPY
jgi:endonuclease-3